MRLLVWWILVSLCFSSCKSDSAQQARAASLRPMSVPSDLTSPADLKLREKAVRAEIEAYDEVTIRHDATALPDIDKTLWRALRDAAATVEDIYSLQLHPRSLAWREQVVAQGTDFEKRLVERNRLPWCETNLMPYCTALAGVGPRSKAVGLWGGEVLSSQQVDALGREINGIELRSPFTVVRPLSGRGYEAIPYARSELLGPSLERLAMELERAAGATSSKTLAAFLHSRSASLRSDEPFPYDASDLDWLAVDGDVEVTVGPYETYDDPHGIKAMFLMVAGTRDAKVEAESAAFVAQLPQNEEALASLVGEPLRQAYAVQPQPVVRAVDAWIVSGQARRVAGALGAYHLPNRGAAVQVGRSKKVLLINHIKVTASGLAHTARGVLGEAAARRVDAQSAVRQALLHEIAHGLGPSPESQVLTGDGKAIVLQQALGADALFYEELKASVIGLWLVERAAQQGQLTMEDADCQRVTAIAQAFDALTHPAGEPHARAAAALLVGLEKRGAWKASAQPGESRIFADAWRTSVESMSRALLQGLLHADVAGLRSLRADAGKLLDLASSAHQGGRPVTLSYVIAGL